MNDILWNAKLCARLHDPAEKALILMRTREGHEGGTSKTLLDDLLSRPDQDAVREAVMRADHWASAADRAAFPNVDGEGRWPAWQTVRFDEAPVLIHPLTGESFNLKSLPDIAPEQAKEASLAHFRSLVQPGDVRRTALTFWRFGPELRNQDLGALWTLLPADTRVPDHTIWDHLDLTSAFAGAFAEGGVPALLAVSLGPVQSFIASARSTSDLWAGSHLLSRMAWEAMSVICDELGPDAILFPRLRGVPLVDLWLQRDCGLPAELFAGCAWRDKATDANPLFAAALPNRFTAIVPAARSREIGERIRSRVQGWAQGQAQSAFRHLLDAAGIPDDPGLPGYAQIDSQLAGFPEVHWASASWSLAATDAQGKVDSSDPHLADAMRPFFADSPPGYLGSPAWRLLGSGALAIEHGRFWKPNPGALYPALHELLERALAATKTTREFGQSAQYGWRCSLSGEDEWLTTDRTQLDLPPGQRKDTLWNKVARERKSWVKQGEHLGALATLKRLWPTLFVEELGGVAGDVRRFVVSTHTFALAGGMQKALEAGAQLPPDLEQDLLDVAPRAALPPRLARNVARHPQASALFRLPGWLEAQSDSDGELPDAQAGRRLAKWLGSKPEAYYALILMDGDEMGAWLSAAPGKTRPHSESYHPQIRQALQNRFQDDAVFQQFARADRAPNPAWHMAISEALNHFALTLAPAVLHEHFNGRVLYAGGDDLLAMLPVTDLLPAMAALRAVYSGIETRHVGALEEDVGFERQQNGFVRRRGQVLRVMGSRATASIGAVVAHHQTPLNLVLRELRVAEQRAKREGGRDAFSITVLKRSGGAQRLTLPWRRADGNSPMTCLRELAKALSASDASRRAAYLARQWAVDLPGPAQVGGQQAWREMVAGLLETQFHRQKLDNSAMHARRLAALAPLSTSGSDGGRALALDHIDNVLAVAEFLAREGRG